MNNYQPPQSMDNPFDRKSEGFVKTNERTEIHQVMLVEHFEKLIGFSSLNPARNTLVSVLTWDDINEGFRYKIPNRLADGSKVSSYELFLQRTYGQCWSLNDEAETCYMWHCYHSEHKESLVQISTTIGQLWNSVKSAGLLPTEEHYFYLRKVEYTNIENLRKQLDLSVEEQAKNGPDAWQESLIATMFAKKMPFCYEREIRLLFESVPSNSHQSIQIPSTFSYQVDPRTLINRVVASPFMSDRNFVCLKCKMRNSEMGSDSKLVRSRLFD